MKTLTYAKAGFTLVELVVVVVILAILAAVVVPVVGDKVDAARVTAARATMKEVANAFNQYRIDTGAWPSNTPANLALKSEDIDFYDYACLYANSGSKPNWNGPYLNDGLMDNGAMRVAVASSNDGFRDPWKSPYRVFNFADGYSGGQGAIMLLSPGQNGVIDSKAADVYADRPVGDDLVQVVTRKLAVGSTK